MASATKPRGRSLKLWASAAFLCPLAFSYAGAPSHGNLTGRWEARRVPLQAKDGHDTSEVPKATVLSTAVSLAKGMLGSGALSLSANVAAFTQTSQGLGVATSIIFVMTMLAAYTFQMVAKISSETSTEDFGTAWSATVGEETSWMPRLAVGILSGITCTVYAMILGDLVSGFLHHALPAAGAYKVLCSRGSVLVSITCFVLLPLCLAEDFSSLAFTSLLGLVACVYLAFFAITRAFDGSYLPGGQFFPSAPYGTTPLVGARKVADAVNIRALVFLSNVSTAYMNHGMAPPTFQELRRGADTSSQALRRYRLAVLGAFGVAGFVCTALMAAGFKTFGASASGLLLSNYSGMDHAASLGKLGVMVSILFGYPLNFILLRTEVAAALSGSESLGRNQLRWLTAALLAVTSGAAAVLKDIGVVQAVVGSIFGSFIVFVSPALMSRGLRRLKGWPRRSYAAVEVLLAMHPGRVPGSRTRHGHAGMPEADSRSKFSTYPCLWGPSRMPMHKAVLRAHASEPHGY
ncbi:unnamed protein product [Effrenium voratum]|nr:unnamed protein product [Effrenium voratum]